MIRLPAVRAAFPLLLLLPVSLGVGGCDVEPYCLTCVDGGSVDGGPDGGRADGGAIDAGNQDAEVLDGEVAPDGCVAGATELCNMRDDDCDSMIDEGIDTMTSLDHCGGCGRACAPIGAIGQCVDGVCEIESCDVGRIDLDMDPTNGCEYRCIPTDTVDARCDRRDDDCDGVVDEDFDLMTDPMNCGACGRLCRFAHGAASCEAGACTLGACEPGFYDADGVAANGCEYACTAAPGGVETCNLRDDDCDGSTDEGDPGGGAACGTDTGECARGVLRCMAGAVTCVGGVSTTTEICNGRDDDCDGSTDENNPDGGRFCGLSEGACEPGREQCTGGSLVCTGAVGPVPESCNAADDDCDARVDEGNPGGGAACGTSTGECMAGALTCTSGSIVCVGATGPVLESCNTRDDDCDGATDETFMLTTDVNNCGMCGRRCMFANAIPRCTAGSCGIAACLPGFVNRDGVLANGCEYACDFAGAEACNGRDDDCDGTIDEALAVPSTFCSANGVCAGTVARCAGMAGWACDYPPATYQMDETRCDSLDNDCDGRVDEAFPLVGTSCTNGEVGACRRTGMYVCNGAGTGVMCTAPASGGGTAETCNDLDDDCDNNVDENALGTWVQVSVPGLGNRWVMSYEASRPDSTGTRQGTTTHHVCSEPGRIPWTQVTYPQAVAACATVGATLCSEQIWQRACETSAGTACRWSYSSACTTYSSMRCNGNDYDSDPGTPGDQDSVLATGALPMCYANWGGAGRIYDLSGNVEEWALRRSAGVNPVRGGSYNDAAGGMQCGFDFVVAGDTIALPTVGFRCCRTTAP